MPINVVILIDLNSLPDYRKQNSATDLTKINPSTSADLNCSTTTGETATSLFEKSAVDFKEDSNEIDDNDDRLMKYVKWIQENVLILLSKEATHNNQVDYSEFYWSYYFYNSAKDLPTKFGKRFHNLDATSFEAFEKHLVEEFRDVYAQNKNCPDINKMSCLSSVIKNMIGGDLTWNEPKVETEDSQVSRRRDKNVLYAFLRVPRSESECLNFVDDVSVLARSHNFVNTLLPRAFFKEFHNKLRIQLNFVDMWYAHENVNVDSSWDETYAAPLSKVLHYLNGGKVIPLSKMEFVPQGLPSYFYLLKLTLKAGSETKPHENKRLSGLQKSSSVLKISPETEDSFALSMKSNSTTNSITRKRYGGSMVFNNSQGREMNPVNNSVVNRNNSFHAPPIKSEVVDNDDGMCGIARESPAKRIPTKRKRRPLKMKIKRELPSTQGSSDDDTPKYSVQLCNSDERIVKPKGFENNVQSLLNNSNRSQEDVTTPSIRHNEKARVNGNLMKQPLTAPSKLSLSPSRRLSRGHALLAKAKQGNSENSVTKTEYINRVLKRNNKRCYSEAGSKKSELRESHLKEMKARLTAFVNSITLNEDDSEEEIIQALSLKLGIFKDMVLIDGSITDVSLVSLAQSLVNVLTVTLRQFPSIKNTKHALEKIILVSYESLNVDIMQHKFNSSTSSYAFLKCQLQILLKFELAWLWPGNEDDTLEIRDDVLKLLNLITAYRKEPPIRNFIVDTLMDAYAEVQGPLVAAVFKGMAISLPKKMLELMSPAAVEKNFPDDISQASSLDSSISQLDSISVDKSHYQSNSQSHNRQSVSIKPSFRNSLSYNPRRPITVPAQKLARSHKIKGDSAKKKLGLTVSRASPNRVRRNLFDVKTSDREDTKKLISLATSMRFSRSPSVKFRSPCSMKSRSPRSPAFIRGFRSKRRLQLDDTEDTQDGGILCPESPSTPNSAYYKRTRMATSFGSTEKNVIQASPEVAKIKKGKRPLTRVDSLSFYSTKSTSEKAIAWEKSGEKMMAARIKDSVDLTQSLLLDDLEFVQGSPDKIDNLPPLAEETPEAKLPIQNSSKGFGLTESPYHSAIPLSDNDVEDSEKPCCSKSLNYLNVQFEVSPNNTSPNIEALIRSENFPPSSMILNQRNTNSSKPCMSILETPTKKVQFNFNENLINTPSPVHNLSTTPKSILK